MSSPKEIAFLGATGGCVNAALAHALLAGYHCQALARTPLKLTKMLLSKAVPQATLDSHLTITAGNVTDIAAVRTVLSTPSDGVVDIILSGIGMVPPKSLSEGMDLMLGRGEAKRQGTICTDAWKTVERALGEMPAAKEKKPFLIVLSSTGMGTSGVRDLPLAMVPMYKALLGTPHKDKREMERLLAASAAVSGWSMVRPSLLTNGKALGTDKVRVGTEKEPAVGYTISRDDVGLWIWEKMLKGDGLEGVEAWKGTKPTLTY